MNWILILWMVGAASSYPGYSITIAEFSTEKLCQEAAQKFLSVRYTMTYSNAICVRKK